MLGYIAAAVIYTNAQRPSVIQYMEVNEYLNRVQTTKREVIEVAKHKTGRYRGPAKLVIDEPFTKDLLERYHRNIRRQLTVASVALHNRFFLLHNGKEFRKVYEVMRSIAIQFGMDLPTPTTYRKVIATEAKETLKMEEIETLQDHMGHSKETAQRHYQVHTTKAAIQSHTKIKQLAYQKFTNKQSLMILKEWPLENGKTPSLKLCNLISRKYHMDKTAQQIQDRWKTLFKKNNKQH